MEAVTNLLEATYFASMKREESRGVVCTLIYITNPTKPDPNPPPRIRPQRWSYVGFDKPIPLTTRNLAKLAHAAPPSTTSLAVFCDKHGQPFISGMFDQEIHYRNFLNYEGGHRFVRPGLFQIDINGIGNLSIHSDSVLIASLRQSSLVNDFHDVLHNGPIAGILRPYMLQQEQRVKSMLPPALRKSEYWKEQIRDLWLGTLCRILLLIQRHEHGGALLITPSESISGLNLKYRIKYDKLDSILAPHIANAVTEDDAWRRIHDDYIEVDQGPRLMPPDLYLCDKVAGNNKDDAITGALGCVNFIASLAQVDGLVLLSRGFRVRGFGVEITTKQVPPKVATARKASPSQADLLKGDYNQLGTRHRSMMRYCYAHGGSVGFVVSQDGDIRAMAKIGKRLTTWENVKLQEMRSLSIMTEEPYYQVRKKRRIQSS